MVSAGLLRNFNNAFRLSIPKKSRKESVSELKRAIEAVRLSRKIAFVTGIFILLFSGLMGALYTAAVVFVLLPMESMLRARLWSRQEDKE